jgi:hypothetical protein
MFILVINTVQNLEQFPVNLCVTRRYNHVTGPCPQPLQSGLLKLKLNYTPWLWSASELYRPSDHRQLAKLVPTFADRGCRVVSAKDSHGRKSRFSRPEPLLFPSSSSSVVLTRLSEPRSRHAASQKIGNRTRDLWICSQKL